MALLGPLRRLFIRRPLYKRVASTGSNRRNSDPPSPELDDEDPYIEDDELIHGPFVYCAFLMLGRTLRGSSLIVGLAMLLRRFLVGWC